MCRLLCCLALLLMLSLVSVPLRAAAPPALHEGKTLTAWMAQLQDPNGLRKQEATEALIRLGPGAKQAVPVLITLLGRKDDYSAHYCAARVLKAIGPDAREAIPALLSALLPRDRYYRLLPVEVFKALDAIGPEGMKAAIPFLRKTLSDREAGERRWSAAESLGLLGPRAKDALPELAAASDDRDRTLRVYAAEALWRIEKSKDSVPILLSVLKARDEEDGHGRMQAAEALGRLGSPAPGVIAALVEVLRDGKRRYDRVGAVIALEELGPAAREAVPAFIELSRDPDMDIRSYAPRVLLAIGPGAREAVPALWLALTDEYFGTRSIAASALWAIGKPEMEKPAVLREGLKDDKVWVRIHSAWLLARADNKAGAEVISVLTAALADRETRASCAAAYLLGILHLSYQIEYVELRKALPALEKALSDKRPGVREAAKRAIEDIDSERYKQLGLK